MNRASELFAPDGTAYDLSGPESAPVVALIHGLGLCRHIWDEPVSVLAQHFRVLNYDLYGHGDSAPLPSTASLTLYAEQLLQLLDLLNIPTAHVIGFSIGGMINRRFALNYEKRLQSLIILNSPHNRGEQAQQQVEARAKTVRDQGTMSTMDDALKRWFTEEYLNNKNNEPLVSRVRAWRKKADSESYAQAAWVLANGVRELIDPTPAISAPALIITSENDTGSTPAMSHAIAAEITDAQTHIVPHMKHLGLLEDANAFTTPILQFLTEQLR